MVRTDTKVFGICLKERIFLRLFYFAGSEGSSAGFFPDQAWLWEAGHRDESASGLRD